MVRSGAGAAVASGASFQARVAAYLIATFMCKADSPIASGRVLSTISFETAEPVDDLNVTFDDGLESYVQAKAALSYSIKETSELYSVLDQFVRQYISNRKIARYVLVTTGRSSKKLIYDFRAALDAFRSASEDAFKRDQPNAIQEIIDEIRAVVRSLLNKYGDQSETDGDAIIRLMYVVALDLEEGATLEEASIILLQASGFFAPRAVWGKLIADSLTHAKQRHTLKHTDLNKSYEQFRTKSETPLETGAEAELFRVEFGDMPIATGKEVVLCEIRNETLGITDGLAILEMYRFDEDCGERCKFTEGKVELLNGLQLDLIRRAATLTGMSRLLESHGDIINGRSLTIVPMNTDEDFETSPCAELHRERLKAAALVNQTPLICLVCGKAVSTNTATVVETGPLLEPRVGMVHDACLRPADRVIGLTQSDFFQKFPDLINFDANAWFRASHGGQMAFQNAEAIASVRTPILAWGGRDPAGPLGDYVVEIALQNGEREIVTQRNAVHRFSKTEAEAFVARLNAQFQEARSEGDPICYSDQSKAYGPRSIVLEIVGGKEIIRPVERARTRAFQAEFAARYSRPGQWYAPVFYLIRHDTDETVSKDGAFLLLTDPLTLGNHLSNWKQSGLLLNEYEVRSILTDGDFDDFMRWSEDAGFSVIVDAIFDLENGRLISGTPVLSIEAIVASK